MRCSMEKIGLPQKYKDILESFIEAAKDIYQEGLVSVILYGSAASGEFNGRHSNINLLVVLDDAGLENLSRIAKVVSARKFKILSPLFFTEDYIKGSTDVFPIEFLDMKENYSVIYGKNVLTGLEIEMRNLRFQCEHELKARLINIKKNYLATLNKNALKQLLFKSFNSSLHILRNLIRIRGGVPPYLKEDILNELGREFNMDTAALKKVLSVKNSNLNLSHQELEDLFFVFVRELEKIIAVTDKL